MSKSLTATGKDSPLSGLNTDAVKAQKSIETIDWRFQRMAKSADEANLFKKMLPHSTAVGVASAKIAESQGTMSANALNTLNTYESSANVLKKQNSIISSIGTQQVKLGQTPLAELSVAKTGKEFVAYTKAARDAVKETEKLGQATGEATKQYGAMDQAMGVVKRGLVGMFAFGALTAIADFGKESFKLAATLEDLRVGIKYVSEEYDIAGQVIADSMKTMSQGILSEAEAIKRVNQGALLGGKELAESMPDLFNIVRVNARAMGIDTGYALESMTIGLGRLSARWLDNLGIVIDTRRSYRDLATELGKTVGDLTDAERRIALVNEVIRKYGVDVSESLLTTSEQVQAASSSWEDYQAAFGRALTETGLFLTVMKALDNMTVGMNLKSDWKDTSAGIGDSIDAVKKYSDVWYKLIDISSRANSKILAAQLTALSNYETVDESAYVKAMQQVNAEVYNMLLGMTKVERTALGKLVPAYQAMITHIDKTKYSISGLTDGWATHLEIISPEHYDDVEEAYVSLEEKIKSFANGLSDAGVALKDVQEYADNSTAKLYALRSAMNLASDPYELYHLIAQYIIEIKDSANLAKDSVSELKKQLVTMAPLMSEFGEYEIKGQTLEVLEYESEMTKKALDATKAAREEDIRSASAYASKMKTIYEGLKSDVTSAVMSGLDVKDTDFLDPNRLDAPLEAVRRLRDIANLGMDSPWTKMFTIPQDVLDQGQDAIKAWARNMADRGAELRDITLIDKDAFLRELEDMRLAAEEKENVIKTLISWATEAGLSQDDAKTYAEQMVGKPSADGIVEGLGKIGDMGAGEAMAKSIKASVIKAKKDYISTGETMALYLLRGISKWIAEHPLTIPVALSGVPPAPGGLGGETYDGGKGGYE